MFTPIEEYVVTGGLVATKINQEDFEKLERLHSVHPNFEKTQGVWDSHMVYGDQMFYCEDNCSLMYTAYKSGRFLWESSVLEKDKWQEKEHWLLWHAIFDRLNNRPIQPGSLVRKND
jgi:hypothetical protein